MLIFAYDGSLNGDWVAHYALRFAANTPERRLGVVHVHEASAPERQLPERVARIVAEGTVLGVAVHAELVRRGRADVASRILEAAPAGATVIAGARAQPRAGTFLAGTITARLLDAHRRPVIAIRVVHPGALGQPERVLLPVADRAGFATGALPILHLLGPDLDHLHLVLIRQISRLRARFQSQDAIQRLVTAGRRHVSVIEEELRAGLAPHHPILDSSVVVAFDAARELALQAARHRSRLICLDADAPPLTSPLAAGSTLERVLRDAPADVAIYRTAT